MNKTSHHYLIRQCLFSKDKNVRTMTQSLSHCHQNLVNEIDKVASSSIDDKRLLSDNSVYSLTFGHFLTGNTFNDSNERQPAWCFENVCNSLVSPTTGFGKLFTLFFGSQSSNCYYSYSYTPTCRSSSSTTQFDCEFWTDSGITEANDCPKYLLER